MFDLPRHFLRMPLRLAQLAGPLHSNRAVTALALALAAVTVLPAAAAAHRVARTAVHPAVRPHATAAKGAHGATSQSRVATQTAARTSRHAKALPVAAGKGKHGHDTGSGKTAGSISHAQAKATRSHDQYTPLSVASASLSRDHRAAALKPVAQQTTPPASAPKQAHRDVEAPLQQAAEAAVQDRVHAWYATRTPTAGAASAFAQGVPTAPIAAAVKSSLLGSTTPLAALPKDTVALPSQAAADNLAADAQRAARKEAQLTQLAPPAARELNSTADDDAAYAEASHIPGTAPTERVALPFAHGDFAPAETAHLAATTMPRIVRIDPRADADVLASASRLPRPSAAPLPSLKPPVPATLSAAPATTAIKAAATRPKLDPIVADRMASEAFDEDDAPPSAQGARSGAAGRRPAGYDLPLNGSPATNVALYDGAGQLILLPPMKGSHDILVHQNQMALSDGLDRIANDAQMTQMRRLKLLVALPDTDAVYPNSRLPLNRRYARPWTVRFLNDLGAAHFQRFHTSLIVTSAARTVAFQRHLVLVNGNAAPPTGDVASPHLYGQAIDLAKHTMSIAEIAWMRSYLTPVETAGKIDVEEEFQQACFHISVYRRYAGLPGPNRPLDSAPQRTLQLATASQPTPETRPMQRVNATSKHRHHLPTALLATGLR